MLQWARWWVQYSSASSSDQCVLQKRRGASEGVVAESSCIVSVGWKSFKGGHESCSKAAKARRKREGRAERRFRRVLSEASRILT
jgi:hypothetical protein